MNGTKECVGFVVGPENASELLHSLTQKHNNNVKGRSIHFQYKYIYIRKPLLDSGYEFVFPFLAPQYARITVSL